MNIKITIELLIVLALVGIYFIFFDRGSQTSYERQLEKATQRQNPGTPLFTADQLSTESVTSVTIQPRIGDPIVLTKEGQDWYQTQPVRFALNTWDVRRLIDHAAGLHYTERFLPGQGDDIDRPSLEQTALTTPRATVTLQSQGDKPAQHTLQLGRSGFGARSFVRVNDDPHVYAVGGALHQSVLHSKPTQWRKRSITAPTEGQTQQLSLTHKGQTATVRKAHSDWALAAPHAGRASAEAVKELLAAIGQLHIADFITDNPADPSAYGLDAPQTTLSVTLPPAPQPATTQPTPPSDDDLDHNPASNPHPQPTTHTLLIGAAQDLAGEYRFAAWSSDQAPALVVFTISKADADQFIKTVNDLRDPRITPLPPSDIRELTITQTQARDEIRLLRSPAGWAFAHPGPGFEADGADVSALVESITNARAQSYTPDAQLVVSPIATATLAAIGRSQPDVLNVYPPDENDLYPVVRNQETVAYHVAQGDLAGLFQPALALRLKTVVDVTPDQAKQIIIEQPGPDGVTYIFEREVRGQSVTPSPTGSARPPKKTDLGPWALAGHAAFETQAFNALRTQLLPLRATRWPARRSIQPRPATDQLPRVNIALPDGTTHRIAIDPSQTQATRIDANGHPIEWFDITQTLLDLIGQEYRQRTVFPIEIDQVQQIRVIEEPGPVVIKRDASGQYTADNGLAIDSSAVGALFDTLAGLRVERYLPPVHVPQPPVKFEVTTKQGKTHRLAFAQSPQHGHVATNGDQWFTLDGQTLNKLNQPLLKKNQP